MVVDIAPQISKKTKKYEPGQVYLSFSDITDQCRTGRTEINPVNIKNIYYLKYDDLDGQTLSANLIVIFFKYIGFLEI